MVTRGSAKTWNYKFIMEKLYQSVSSSPMDPAPLILLAITLLAPRTIADQIANGAQRHANSREGGKSPCLTAWKSIKETTTAEDMAAIFLRFTKGCRTMVEQAKKDLTALSSVEQPQKYNPVLLMREYVGLPSKSEFQPWNKLFAREREIVDAIKDHEEGIDLKWPFRRLLLIELIASSKRWRYQRESLLLVMRKVRDAKSPEDVVRILSDAAYEAKYTSLEMFLNMKRSREGPESGSRSSKFRKEDTSNPLEGNDKEPSSSTADSQVRIVPRKEIDETVRAPRGFNPPSYIRKVAEHHNVNMVDLMHRMNRKQCILCGDSSHHFKSCKSFSSHFSAYSKNGCVASVSDKGYDLLVGTAIVSFRGGRKIPIKCGFDSMASLSIVNESTLKNIALKLGIDHIESTTHSRPRQVSGLASSTRLERTTSLCILFRGYEVQQECWILPEGVASLPAGLDVNIGYSDLRNYGITIQLPTNEPDIVDLRLANSDVLRSAVEQKLAEQVGVYHSLPGGKKFLGTLRTLESAELRDTAQQRWTYEVHWDMDSISTGKNQSFDYSISMFDKLSTDQLEISDSELRKLTDPGWWWKENDPNPPVPAERALVLPDEIVSFPLLQSTFKSTKIRLCSDARELNKRIPRSSYCGQAVGECLDTIRGNYSPGDALHFVDLQKAFYKLRLGGNRVLRIRCNGQNYFTNRVIFGISCGPSALNGQILTLLNASLSVFLGKDVKLRDVREANNLIPGVTIVIFYDDLCIFGDEEKCRLLIEILSHAALLVGGEFPADKHDELSTTAAPVRHLGAWWSVNEFRQLVIQCVPIPPDALTIQESMTRRLAFAIAGHRYDPMKLHPVARLVANRIRRWFGKSEGGNTKFGWNRRWNLTPKQMGILQYLLDLSNADMTDDCKHYNAPPEYASIEAYCDASGSGYGFSVHLVGFEEPAKTCQAPYVLEETAEEYGDNERSWHINRKECLPMLRVLQRVLYWVNILRRNITEVRVFSDNSSAVAWASDKPPKAHNIETIEIQRLQSSMRAIVETLKEDHNCEVQISHIKGSENTRADFLSRALKSIPQLSPLGKAKATANAGHGSKDDLTMIVTDTNGDVTVCPNSHNPYTGLTRTAIAPTQESHSDAAAAESNDDTVFTLVSNDAMLPVTEADARDVQRFDSLGGIGDLSEAEILDHVREALACHTFTQQQSIFDLPLNEVLSCLRALDYVDSVPDRVSKVCAGGVHGQYLSWDSAEELLIVSDPSESEVRWRVYLPTKRARAWAVFLHHDHPLISFHKSLQRVLHSLRHAPKGVSFWWDGMTKYISKMLKSCRTCQLAKHHTAIANAPTVSRRWQQRFRTIQLDFAGPFHRDSESEPSPWGAEYLCVMICECTNICLVVPTASTSARDVIGALTIWFSTYGVPEAIQLDACPAHDSQALRVFVSAWSSSLKLGIPRRPECQGKVERLIRDIKEAVRVEKNLAPCPLPWWQSALSYAIVHNTSPIKGGFGLTPMELSHALEPPNFMSPPTSDRKLDPDQIQELWLSFHSFLSTTLENYLVSRAERSLCEEVKVLAGSDVNLGLLPGQQVLLSQIIDGKRALSGPFTIARRDSVNPTILYLEGLDKPVSLNQLVLYHSDMDRDALEFATEPVRTSFSTSASSSLPNGIRLTELEANVHWVVYKELDPTRAPDDEPVLLIYAARFLSGDQISRTIEIQGLDHKLRTNTWVLPPRSERHLAVKHISYDQVIGSAGFKPTARGMVPLQHRKWFESQGCIV